MLFGYDCLALMLWLKLCYCLDQIVTMSDYDSDAGSEVGSYQGSEGGSDVGSPVGSDQGSPPASPVSQHGSETDPEACINCHWTNFQFSIKFDLSIVLYF